MSPEREPYSISCVIKIPGSSASASAVEMIHPPEALQRSIRGHSERRRAAIILLVFVSLSSAAEKADGPSVRLWARWPAARGLVSN